MFKREKNTPEFKTKVALEALGRMPKKFRPARE